MRTGNLSDGASADPQKGDDKSAFEGATGEAALPNAASPLDAYSSSSVEDLPAVIGKTAPPQLAATKTCQPTR